MDNLLTQIRDHHFPNSPATLDTIAAFESRVGWKLDDELRRFYLFSNGAKLFRRNDSPFYILPLDKIVRTRVAITGQDIPDFGPDNWWALVDVQDGNYLAVDIAETHNGRYAIRDVFHETCSEPDDCKIIAQSFAGFLAAAVKSNGKHFWLGE